VTRDRGQMVRSSIVGGRLWLWEADVGTGTRYDLERWVTIDEWVAAFERKRDSSQDERMTSVRPPDSVVRLYRHHP
jgi:hypothetical protein